MLSSLIYRFVRTSRGSTSSDIETRWNLRPQLPATYTAPEVFQLRGEAVAVSPLKHLVLDILSSPLSRRQGFSLKDFCATRYDLEKLHYISSASNCLPRKIEINWTHWNALISSISIVFLHDRDKWNILFSPVIELSSR